MNAAHGIMFHHFHDSKKHVVCQGSISADTFRRMLDFYAKQHHIMSADIFMERALAGTLGIDDVCLTFDDGLLCQYDIALSVLDERNLKAFWFIYTSPFDGVLEKLEIYHHFRFSCFSDIDAFYAEFFETAEKFMHGFMSSLKNCDTDTYLSDSPFYTVNDKLFRYGRDHILNVRGGYDKVMEMMFAAHGYVSEKIADFLWLKKEQVASLSENGHIIGLHSYSHPTDMTAMPFEMQFREYSKCKESIENITGKAVVSASYPCGKCNAETLRVMDELGIQIAFSAFMKPSAYNRPLLEIPREDHANILRSMHI